MKKKDNKAVQSQFHSEIQMFGKTQIKLHRLNPKILTIGTQDWIKDTPDRDVSRGQKGSTSRSITKSPTCTSTKNLANFVGDLSLVKLASKTTLVKGVIKNNHSLFLVMFIL